MNAIIYVVKEFEDWHDLVQYVLKNFGEKKIFLLNGNLGSGKTTFVQVFGKVLKVREHITSPTFSIMHEYHYSGGKIYHFDLYRIKSIQELKNIGIEEYLFEDNYCFIEWPQLVEHTIVENEELKNKSLNLEIRFNEENGWREVWIK